MRDALKVIGINAGILLVGVLLLEIFWRLFFVNDLRTLNILEGISYHFDVNKLYDNGGEMIFYSRDENGLRGDYPALDQIDILTIGGSTTDQRFLDNSATWQAVLQRELATHGKELNVVNAGVDGQSSYGHIKNFELWFPNLDNFQPKYILFYVGVNDVYTEMGEKVPDTLQQQSDLKSLIKESALYRLVNIVSGILKTQMHQLGHQPIDFASLPKTKTPSVDNHAELMANRLDAYNQRLAILLEHTQKLGAKPIFITQRMSSYWQEANGDWIGVEDSKKVSGESLGYNGIDEKIMLDMLNEKTLQVCAEVKGICVDLGKELDLNLSDFYDFTHNTPAGAEKIGRFMAQKIAPVL